MRITGGENRGRILAIPTSGAIRPTQDRVREALFSMLFAELPGAAFLDLFAGTGAVGLEALSRGAASATFVERNPRHAATLKKNIDSLAGSARTAVLSADAYAWAKTKPPRTFDIAFADPPYAEGADRGFECFLDAFAANGTIRPGGIFAAETDGRGAAPEHPAWTLWKDRKYGKTRILMWIRKEEDGK